MTDRDWQDLLLQRDKTIEALREDIDHNIEQSLGISKERDALKSELLKAKELLDTCIDFVRAEVLIMEIQDFLNKKL